MERITLNFQKPALRVALLGSLCALAIVGRIAMAPIPNVQPVTVLLMLIGLYFGAGWASVCSLVVVLVTNLFLGMGLWTFYQIAVWALIAAVTALLFRRRKNILLLTVWAVFTGYAYGFFVSLWSFQSFVSFNGGLGFWAYYLQGLVTVDTYHALGNGVFMWFLFPLFRRLFAAKQTEGTPQ